MTEPTSTPFPLVGRDGNGSQNRLFAFPILLISYFQIMNKTYICPAFSIEEAQAAQMLAESLAINSDTTVDGGEALTKEASWDIWEAE